jgi:hypothetical protein
VCVCVQQCYDVMKGGIFPGLGFGLVWDGVGCIHGVWESKLVGNFYLFIHFFFRDLFLCCLYMGWIVSNLFVIWRQFMFLEVV